MTLLCIRYQSTNSLQDSERPQGGGHDPQDPRRVPHRAGRRRRGDRHGHGQVQQQHEVRTDFTTIGTRFIDDCSKKFGNKSHTAIQIENAPWRVKNTQNGSITVSIFAWFTEALGVVVRAVRAIWRQYK